MSVAMVMVVKHLRRAKPANPGGPGRSQTDPGGGEKLLDTVGAWWWWSNLDGCCGGVNQ